GSSHRRSVRVRAPATHLEVVVPDDGVGFDPSSVETHRLGITVSIRGRMRQLDGGSATIRSSPGRGTSVTLTLSLPVAVMT
ncbi:MAG: ATP-binding protein, partial [Rhodococcus sp.]|nr:ATP-binding protein [Rhodococcus sp. (in: high G+C Gram-positive bacteria)]